ncbi:MAG: hypothetical protein ACPGWR_19865 [Ardenticatenaceae bacterium]
MENRIITGLVDRYGDVTQGQGFDVEYEPVGYRITFYELNSPPTVVCQAWEHDEAITFVTRGVIQNQVLVAALNNDGNITECSFSFIAVPNNDY